MANPCAPNASQPNPAYTDNVIFSSLAIASYLNNKGMTWAYAIAPALGTLTYELPSFCVADPPVIPTPTAADVLGWFNPLNPQGAAQLRQVMGDLVGGFLWFDLCNCAAGPQPTPPAAVAAPTGLTLNPGQLTNVPNAPCMTIGDPKILSQILCFPNAFANVADIATGTVPSETAIPLSGSGPYSVVLRFTNNESGANSQFIENGTIAYWDASGATLRTDALAMAGSGTLSRSAPAGTVAILVNGPSRSPVPAAGHFCWTGFDVYCGGQSPGGTQTQCCPPDSTSQQLAQQILQLVTLLQRQLLPFAYVAKTAHAGLTGQGSFAVADLLGVKVNVTTLPTQLGEAVGEPTFLFDVGWLSILTGDGLIEERRVSASQVVWTPRLMSEAVTLGYSFHPGVVATVTELVREE